MTNCCLAPSEHYQRYIHHDKFENNKSGRRISVRENRSGKTGMELGNDKFDCHNKQVRVRILERVGKICLAKAIKNNNDSSQPHCLLGGRT